jgi:8-oxo-dGTP diphosphatase
MPRGKRKHPEPTPSRFNLDELPRLQGITVRVEVVLMAIHESKLRILMLERDQEPYAGGLSLPGQYLYEDSSIDEMARIIPMILGIKFRSPLLFDVFSNPERDRRHRAIAVGFLCAADLGQMNDLVHRDPRFHLVAFDPGNSPDTNLMYKGDAVLDVAFDHHTIITRAFIHMQHLIDNTMLAFDFLPPTFTLLELQRVHEIIRRKPLDKVLFRKRMLARIWPNGARLRPCNQMRSTPGRPARLYHLHRDVPTKDTG